VQSRLLTRPALHTAGVYVVLFMATGVQMPFWPLWLADWGLTPEEVGLYTALGVAVRVVAGMAIPALADRLDSRRHTMMACAALTLVLYLAHLDIERKGVLLLATIAVGATMAGIGPIAEALGVAAARSWNFAYAQVRGIGSAGFLAANLIVGAWIAATGSWVALWWIVGCMAALIVLTARHPGARRVEGQIPPDLREIGRLVLHPDFAVFMAAVAFLQASHAVLYALGSLHWRDLGVGETEIGALWAASVAVEIVFMMVFGTYAIERLGPVRAMALSGVAGVVRWGAMMADPTGFWLWPIQGLHALTFAMAHLGAIAFISRAVPDRGSAAAQGATGAMAVGGVMALQMALAAAVYPRLGGGTYAIGVVSSALGLVFCLWLARRWQGQELAV
jgi:PPP family 3-phenylpropionic acid transporter